MVAGVTDALTMARHDITAALRAGLASILPEYRIHETKPPKPAAPQIWLSAFGMQPDTIGDGAIPVVSLTGVVLAPVDGRNASAVAATDLLQAAIWQALNTIATPTGSAVGDVDVGGATLLCVQTSFAATVSITSICPLELIHQEATP